jgi:hypothetical protein
MLDIHQCRRQSQLTNPRRAGLERLVAVLMESSLQELIFDRHAAEDRTIRLSAGRRLVGRPKHLADLKPSAGAHNDPHAARIANGVDRRKPADVP